MGELTAEERGLLSDWWLSGSEGDLFAVVGRILVARRESLAERVRALADEWELASEEHLAVQGEPFPVLRAAVIRLRALLDDPALPSTTHRNGGE
jgi:hypothetical protein